MADFTSGINAQRVSHNPSLRISNKVIQGQPSDICLRDLGASLSNDHSSIQLTGGNGCDVSTSCGTFEAKDRHLMHHFSIEYLNHSSSSSSKSYEVIIASDCSTQTCKTTATRALEPYGKISKHEIKMSMMLVNEADSVGERTARSIVVTGPNADAPSFKAYLATRYDYSKIAANPGPANSYPDSICDNRQLYTTAASTPLLSHHQEIHEDLVAIVVVDADEQTLRGATTTTNKAYQPSSFPGSAGTQSPIPPSSSINTSPNYEESDIPQLDFETLLYTRTWLSSQDFQQRNLRELICRWNIIRSRFDASYQEDPVKRFLRQELVFGHCGDGEEGGSGFSVVGLRNL